MSIPFRQYLRPDGRQKQIHISRPDWIEAAALKIIDYGYRFEAEVLMTGQVSFTIHDPRDERDICCEICPNSPEVDLAVDRLVRSFFQHEEPDG